MNFSFFTQFLKNRNIISKIKISKVTDYAALTAQNKRSWMKVKCQRRTYL